MERLKQALERAKAERLKQTGGSRGSSAKARKKADSEGVVYDQTPVVALSRDALRESRILTDMSAEVAGDAYRLLRTQVLQSMNAGGWNTLGITSAAPGAGKTLTAVNLSLSLAQQFSGTVLLVDSDLRRPAVHKYLGHRPEYGLSDHLLKGVPLSECLFNPGIERLVVLTAGTRLTKTSELLHSPQMQQFLKELKERYTDRLILFDLPPVLVGDDALSILPRIDATLLVVEDGKTSPDELKRSAELLQDTNLIGSVLNKAAEAHSRYYYYY